MATVRDTASIIAFVEGRETLDPNTISPAEWMAIISSVIRTVSLKHLHGFQAAQDIVLRPTYSRGAAPSLYSPHSPLLPRIWLGDPASSPEFKWHSQFLVCGVRHNAGAAEQPKTIAQEYLLLGRDGDFFILGTTWHLRDGEYRFSNSTHDGRLGVQYVDITSVVEWCFEEEENGPYLLRGILERLLDAVQQTEKDLTGRLQHATRQRKALGQRLSAISWVKPGDEVWIVHHFHSWDRDPENEYFPVLKQVLRVEDGLAHFAKGQPRKVWGCFRTEEECRAACPAPHPDP